MAEELVPIVLSCIVWGPLLSTRINLAANMYKNLSLVVQSSVPVQ